MAGRSTIMKVPPEDPSRAPIENSLEITELGVLGPDIFTNTRPPWQPTGARGIFGGVVIAQCLAAAQKTVEGHFVVHSCHCYFLLAGSGTVPIIFHVERVRDGRSFATRTVQARQRGRCIFTATISFVRDDESTAGKRELRHAAPMPAGVRPPPDDWDDGQQARAGWNGPYQVSGMETLGADDDSVPPQERTCRQWIRARGKISAEGGHQAHVNALAYMSDSYFIGTVTRIHRVWRFPWPPRDVPSLPEETRRQIDRVHELEGTPETAEAWEGRPMLGMMVSLDHSIYFHEARRLQADEWMFTEMVSPWADDGRGLVTQRIFARDGTLLATCVQEGVVRLKQDGDENAAKL